MSTGLKGFVPVFEGRLAKMKERLREELSKSKSERSRNTIKVLVKDCKKLNKALKQWRIEDRPVCPHCGERLE